MSTSTKPSLTHNVRRGYTISELKEIIDYVKEIDAYGEIKGRKMWVDFERSGRTTRTWQSLKEVFLKRILTDLHNPYYKLTAEEISSFRVGYSMINNKRNKLEKLTVLKNSPRKVADHNKQADKIDKAVMTNGLSQKKHEGDINRSDSVETVILSSNACYETAEEIQKDLLSDQENTAKTKSGEKLKSKRISDCIRYAEPLTPILKEIFRDFNSDDSNDEKETINNKKKENTNIKNNAKDINVKKKNSSLSKKIDTTKKKESEKDESFKKKLSNDTAKESSNLQNEQEDTPPSHNKKANRNTKSTCRVIIENMDDNITSVDSVIPNNQEALEKSKTPTLSHDTINKRKPLKKRQIHGIVENDDDQSSARKKAKSNLNDDSVTSEATTDGENIASCSKDIVSKSRTVSKTKSSSKQNLGGENIDIKTKAIVTIESHTNSQESPSTSNPCLQSISLYSKEKLVKNDATGNTVSDKVVLLESSSENDSSVNASKSDTTNTLCRLFGYSNERRTSNPRQRKTSYRTNSHTNSNKRESSSEWTSESDSDFVDPPRSERKRSSRRYMKPGSARIMSLENDGGLLISHNNKVYPIISDGGGMRSFLKYKPMHEEFENEELFWKRKYVEEKKRTADLAKILEDEEIRNKKRRRPSPLERSRHTRISTISEDDSSITAKGAVATTIKTEENKDSKQEKTVKFKFVKDGQEMTIEGIWHNIQPILTEVMSIFQKDSKTATDNIKPVKNTPSDDPKCIKDSDQAPTSNKSNEIIVIDEGKETKTTKVVKVAKDDKSISEKGSVDLEARRRVQQLENEIFKEIKEKHNKGENVQDPKVTNRRGRPRTVEDSKPKTVKEKQTNDMLNAKLPNPTSGTRLNMRSHNDIESSKKSIVLRSRSPKSVEIPKKVTAEENDDDVRYKFPSPEHQTDDQPNNITANLSESILPMSRTRRHKQYLVKNLRKLSAPQHSFVCDSDSWDSMQGYRDSDTSFVNIKRQRKTLTTRRRHSTSTLYRRNHAQRRNVKLPHLFTDSSSSNDMPVPQHSTSKDFITDSYDLLMQHRSTSIQDQVILENIDENDDSQSDSENQIRLDLNMSPATQNVDQEDSFVNNKSDSNKIGSSHTSLPESPEISIVECITVSQDVINVNMSDEDVNDLTSACTGDLLRDISKILNEGKKKYPLGHNVPNTLSPIKVTQMSIDEQIHTPDLVNNKNTPCPKIVIEEPNESGVLNDKLSKMILDSAKKADGSKTEVPKATKSKRSRKRSSTPHKRSKVNVDTVIDEHMEYCIQNRGRNSCPPSFGYLVVNDDSEGDTKSDTMLDNEEDQIATKSNTKKREIIKVKILRPRRKGEKKSLSKTKSKESKNKKSDSESSTFLNVLNESVDLIHNHSESCLHTTECVFEDDIVVKADENRCKSLVPAECTMVSRSGSDVSVECLCDDALDISLFTKSAKSSQCDNESEPSSPLDSPEAISLTSLMTDDLSEATPPTKPDWYLLSEEELSNTQPERALPKPLLRNNEYMNKLFPVACTIPDLSTITEASRDTDQSNSNKEK